MSPGKDATTASTNHSQLTNMRGKVTATASPYESCASPAVEKSCPASKQNTTTLVASSFTSCPGAAIGSSLFLNQQDKEITTVVDQPTTLGTLGRFPAEIRDKIYQYLLASKYVISGQPSSVEVAADKFGILRTSKQISRGAQDVLFSKSVFCYRIAINSKSQMSVLLLNQLGYPGSVSMKAIEFEVGAIPEKYFSGSESQDNKWYCQMAMQQIREQTLDLWASPESSCKTLRIRFTIGTVPVSDCFKQLFESLKAMTDLTKLTVEVELGLDDALVAISYAIENLKSGEGAALRRSVRTVLLEMLQSELEPFLGHSSMGDVSETVQYLEFRPRERVTQMLESMVKGVEEV